MIKKNSNETIYELVTNKIIDKLENGVVPWRKPWVNGIAQNWVTEKPYRGVNTMLLEPGEYATFKQITEAGGKVKKGEKSHIVVFWKWLDVKDEQTEEETKIPLLRYYRVFEINTQVEGLTSKRKEQTFVHDKVAEAEKIIKEYINCPTYSHNSGRAYYQPSMDHINVPPMKDFHNVDEYYNVMFHEMNHSTGSKKRLNRDSITNLSSFGSETYSKEELVAEIGAAMLATKCGIDNSTIDNSASYIKSWLRVLKDDKRMVISASSHAQKSVDYILGVNWDNE